jgi:hypothetical protein
MLGNLSFRDPDMVGITDAKAMGNLIHKLKLLDGVNFYAEFRSLSQRIRNQEPAAWSKWTQGSIVKEVRTIHSNNISMGGMKQSNAAQATIRYDSQREDVNVNLVEVVAMVEIVVDIVVETVVPRILVAEA